VVIRERVRCCFTPWAVCCRIAPSVSEHPASNHSILPLAAPREGMLSRAAPFALASAAGIAVLMAVTPWSNPAPLYALLLAIAHTAFAMAVPWRRVPRWLETSVPLLYLPVVVVLREGFSGGLLQVVCGPLFLLPVFWTALYATRTELGMVVGGVTVAALVPRVLHGFQRGEVGLLLVTLLVCGTVAFAVEAMVRARRETAQGLRALIEALPTGLCVVRSGLIRYANPTLVEMLGYCSAADLVGRPLASILSEAERATDSVRDASGPLCAVSDAWLTRPDGDALLAEIHEVTIQFEGRSARAVMFRDVTADRDRAAALELRATTDPLTRIGNRRKGEEALAREAAHARVTASPLCVALFDVDHFKRVNDQHGHAAGDGALRRVARVLAAEARGADTVARWGGEEFIAVLAAPLDGARRFCERVRAAIEADPGEPRITVSVGVAEIGLDEDVDDAIARADKRLYDAKHAGRNRVTV
jgi:diguanylate cyclase (GGDEF)-like protein/PAS domain S-box-containing protein